MNQALVTDDRGSHNGEFFPGYDCQLYEDVKSHSQRKCDLVHQRVLSLVNDSDDERREGRGEKVECHPCVDYENSINYRCICHFQMIFLEGNDKNKWQYGMRSHGEVQSIKNDSFSLATPRIQRAMRFLLLYVNNDSNQSDEMVRGWTSTSFACSWNESDINVTMHFCYTNDEAGKSGGVQDNPELQKQIQFFFTQPCCDWTSITCRSKGQIFITRTNVDKIENLNDDNNQVYLYDEIYLEIPTKEGTLPTVLLEKPLHRADDNEKKIVSVVYRKPSSAFFHPNRFIMVQALEWILRKMFVDIAISSGDSEGYWMELYCGCGAHSMALSKASSIFFSLSNSKPKVKGILALELDPRLVQACQINARLNNAEFQQQMQNSTGLPIHVIQGNASNFSQHWLRKQRNQKSHKQSLYTMEDENWWYEQQYNVLLVDPPRQGLDKSVCQMIQIIPFQHVLYISCGQDALQRDLQILSSHYKIEHLDILDLFPRTKSSIETLVHLKRI